MYSSDKVRESEQSFRLIVDSIPGLVCTMTAGGEVEFVNQQIMDYTGKTLEELRDWRPLVHPDDLALVMTRWMCSIETGHPYEVEHRILGADGVYRWFHVRGLPLRDTEGRIVRWYNLVTDIEDRKHAEEVVLTSEQSLRQIVDSTPGLIVLLTAGGEVEFVNRQGLEYFGKTLEELKIWATKGVVPPDDVPPALTAWRRSVETGDPYNFDHRLRRADGVYRWFNSRALPLRDANSRIVRWYNLLTDIDDRKNAEKKLQRSEECLLEAQRLSQTGSWRHDVASGTVTISPEIHRIFGSRPDEDTSNVEFWFNRIHPDDRKGAQEIFERSEIQKTDYQADYRIVLPDGTIKQIHVIGHPVLNESGDLVEFVGTSMDVSEAKQAEEKIRQSERRLRQILDLTPSFITEFGPDGSPLFNNRVALDYHGLALEEWQSADLFKLLHPQDVERVRNEGASNFQRGFRYEIEARLRRKDGQYRWFLFRFNPVRDEQGQLTRWYAAATDIEDRKQAEEKLRESESYLAEAQRLSHTGSWAWNPATGEIRYWSEECYRVLGFDPHGGPPQFETFFQRIHPHDQAQTRENFDSAVREKAEFELDYRIVHPSGKIRDIRAVGHPVLSPSGDLVEFVGTVIDITERKQAEERLQGENVALREEIDKASMFEEIVGTSLPLQTVLSRVSKVAPTDSNVLITGETGTGKELVARAIHRRSGRSSRPFVSVNCAVIPRDLIASELFGHEKGAFTGATQRRLGRFELAEGGTIFLDEIGEIPVETQIALLRVLQEHEFERVGGVGTIRINVRVIAATNRDLEAAIAAGLFRSDLFYRLNVFPIEMPPLRERREDVPMLVEYFIDRYARRAGKSFQTVNKKSLDLLQSYSWPGNIRELQNVIERSVIVCETENFSVDESWLSRPSIATEPNSGLGLLKKDPSQEKAIIEAALRETGGRVSGPSGAATKLGIHRSTLESKIASLNINKHRFKTR